MTNPNNNKQIVIDPRYTKTYATEKNLNATIEKMGFDNLRHMIVWTESARVTAVFLAADDDVRLMMGAIARKGFKRLLDNRKT